MVVLLEAPGLTDDEPYACGTPGHRIVRYRLRDGTVMPLMIPQRKDRRPVVAVIPLDASGFARLETTRRLLASLHGRKVPRDGRVTEQQRSRHTKMLRTLDGDLAGASQREIAAGLFGIWYPRNEWNACAERFTTQRLLRDARQVVRGGYIDLLHH